MQHGLTGMRDHYRHQWSIENAERQLPVTLTAS
ncbi:hypothetical protein Halru_0066 [Halovivax ruber XH-70]|uniref:Transposase n=1 Tax=Halovivax ruber (strain DSM 18193 / JCM 13892 / XH-70) TaxID=797302 RepID=L0I7F5_HALRX|nr:hypothetical protein Halru_0066 [Halovivax ruber XH-70]